MKLKKEKKNTPKSSVGQKIKWISLIVGGVLLLLVLLDGIVAVSSVHKWITPEKKRWTASPADYMLDYHAFELETPNGTVYGWVMPAQQPMDPDGEEWVEVTEYSDKTMVLAPNYDNNREISDLGGGDYFVDLCSAGYNVITFDWTGSGLSDGKKNVFTLDKVEELKAVVEYAAQETEADFLAVQGIGFSCYPAAVTAADCPQVDALILDTCYEDFDTMFYGGFGEWSSWNISPVRETVRALFPLLSGVKTEEVSLKDPINRMNGKAVFFIQGENDELFGSSHVSNLQNLAAADNRAEQWIVSQAGHLRCRSFDSESYVAKITQFLDKAQGAEGEA